MSNPRPVTLEDVAREANVSVSTASRTLNGQPLKVGLATQERVRAVARRLGYATNLAARAMVVGRSRSVGLVVSGIPDDYQNPVLAGVFHAAGERDLLVTTAITDLGDVDRTSQTIRLLRGQRPSTLIVVGTHAPEDRGMRELHEELEHVEAEGCRVVLIGLGGTPFDSVLVDDYGAGTAMGEVFAGLGYRHVAVLAGTGAGELAERRSAGFVERLRGAGREIGPGEIIWQAFDHDGGYRAAGEVLRRSPVPDAVFCVNDAMAIGASVRFREQGLVVGRDIAVAGCDDIPALRDVDPSITSIHLPWSEAAERAFELAESPRAAARSIVLSGHPVVRASTPNAEIIEHARRASGPRTD